MSARTCPDRCTGCSVPMRPKTRPPSPGVLPYGGHGMCVTCYQSARTRGETPTRTVPDRGPRPDQTWREDAACLDRDTDLWFPLEGQAWAARYAKMICASCPVTDACLADALWEEHGLASTSRHGIRGGTTPGQRARIAAGKPRDDRARKEAEEVCGTPAGATRHHRRDEPVCEPCRDARAQYRQELRARQRDEPGAAS